MIRSKTTPHTKASDAGHGVNAHRSVLWPALASIAAGLLGLPVAAALSFAVAMFLAGPHSGLLPAWKEMLVLAAGWGATFTAPLIVGRYVWRRLTRKVHATQT